MRQAVAEKKVITGWYDGHFREMCPHVIGRKRGNLHALFYQFGGTSRSGLAAPGSPSNWRCIDLDQLSAVSICDGEWHTSYNHSRPQSCVDEIDLQVDF